MSFNYTFDKEKLYFLPLGGAGEFGANFNVYVFQDRYLIADCGMGFADDNSFPGVDITLPDISFLRERKNKIVGLIATHAHEDHIGGIPHLWPDLDCPIYTTPFTAKIIKEKLKETSFGRKVPIEELPLSSKFTVGPFDCEFLTMTHSIPEPNALIIKAGTYKPILHTGDWKVDPDPVVGEVTDFDRQKTFSKDGVLAVIGDSTNACISGHSGSEADVQASFIKLFKSIENRILLTCFSSNIARLKSIALAAEKSGRHVGLVGRSLWRMHDCAKEVGLLEDCPRFLSGKEASYVPRDKIVTVCTGSQGEPRSALFKIAYDDHRDLVVEAGDTLIYSARAIPGNEVNIIGIKNKLVERGIKVIDKLDDHILHVSGHPYEDELKDLYQRLKPDVAIPVHGEIKMLYDHARIANENGAKKTIIPENGTIIEFDKKAGARKVSQIDVDSLLVDGRTIVYDHAYHVKNRKRLGYAGCLFISLVIDKTGTLETEPQFNYYGVIEGHPEEGDLRRELVNEIEDAISNLTNKSDIEEMARRAARRFLRSVTGKKPMTKVIIHEL
tara:strand:+ start:3104 stop:4771 length:1668 start_codon:yes stop_codon:yes gene_type:complete